MDKWSIINGFECFTGVLGTCLNAISPRFCDGGKITIQTLGGCGWKCSKGGENCSHQPERWWRHFYFGIHRVWCSKIIYIKAKLSMWSIIAGATARCFKTTCPRLTKKKVVFHHDSGPAHNFSIAVTKLHELLHVHRTHKISLQWFFLFPNLKKWLGEEFS